MEGGDASVGVCYNCVCVCVRVCVCVCGGGGNLVPTKSIITHKTIRRSSGFCPKFIGSKKSSI